MFTHRVKPMSKFSSSSTEPNSLRICGCCMQIKDFLGGHHPSTIIAKHSILMLQYKNFLSGYPSYYYSL